MRTGAGRFKLPALIIGLALFVYLVMQTGPALIIARIGSLGAGFLLILAIAGLRTVTRSCAWFLCMIEEERRLGLVSVWRARLIGDTAGNLTTAGPLIAEPARIKALKSVSPLTVNLLSLAIETLTYAVSSFLVVIGGLSILLFHFTLNDKLKNAGQTAMIVITLTVVIVFLIVWRRRPLISQSLAGMLRWVRAFQIAPLNRLIDRTEHRMAELRSLEIQVFDFYQRRAVDFFLVVICEILFHVLAFAETFITLRMIGSEVTPAAAFVLEATNRIISMAFSFIPARLGVDEAGSGLLAEALGLGGAFGVALAIVRKARVVVWSAIGLLLLII